MNLFRPTARTLRPLALTFALAAGLSACGGSNETAAPAAPEAKASESHGAGHDSAAKAASGSVSAEDQTGDGTTLTVDEVDLEGIDQGFIGVHMDLDGKPGPVVGVAQVKKGITDKLLVRFDKPVTSGAFWPMLHVDDSTLGTYEFPKVKGADLPVKDGEKIVMKKITLTVG
jgi:hypothetical protein